MNLENINNPVRFLSANVTLLEGALEGFPVRSHIMEQGKIKVGVTSIISKTRQREVFPLGDGEWVDPDPEIVKELAKFDEQGVNVRVLLSQSTFEESKAFAKAYPQFQVIVTAGGIGDPAIDRAPTQVGNTWIIEPGEKGKHVGVFGLYAKDDQPMLRYQLVSLEREDFDDSESMIELMRLYQARLKEEQIVLVDGVGSPHPSGATFVGSQACMECHEDEVSIWKDTHHSHAFASLDPANKGEGHERLNGINRTADPECLACHVTGWDPKQYTRFRSGFLNAEFAQTDAEKRLQSLLADNQCENCHGPGSQHIALANSGADNAADSVRITYENAKSTCIRCHDGDNSPEFDFEKYWKDIEH